VTCPSSPLRIHRTPIHTLIAVIVVFASVAACWASPQQVTILHFNDFHGNLLAPEAEDELGGIARIATLIEQVRAENDRRGAATFVMIAGDVVQGTPLSTVFRGEAEFAALNGMGIDAMTPGNHEFDYGMPNLNRIAEMAQFPIIAANIRRRADDTRVFPGTVRFTVGDEEIVVIGLTTPETSITTRPSNVANLTFEDPAEVAGLIADRATRTRDRVVVALTHLGHEQDLALARDVPKLDLIVGGHSHTKLDEAAMVGNTVVVQAGAYGEYLGRIDMHIANGHIAGFDYRLLPVSSEIEPHPQIAAVVEEYHGRLDDAVKRVIGHAGVFLNGEREDVRSRETNLGNAIADAMRLVSGAQIALQNGGGIRASIDEGPITLEEILVMLPFGNEVATVELTGGQLREILQRSVAAEKPFGGFLQVSGVKVVAEDGEIVEISVGGEPLDPNETYLVATSAFLLEGGDGYEAFTEGQNPYYVGTNLDTSFVNYIAEHGTIAPEVEGRIVMR